MSRPELAEIREGQRPVEAPTVALGATTLRAIAKTKRFWAIAVPRFLAEPAWQTFSFWIPLYLAKERGMDITQIALFAWVPFLAADAGGILGGYLAPFLQRWRGLSLEGSRIAGISLAAVLMIAPGCVGLVLSPYAAIALLSLGVCASDHLGADQHAIRRCLSQGRYCQGQRAGRHGGLDGRAALSLAIGQLADKIGYAPLFACLGAFDLIGAVWLFAMRRHLI
jgi:ACS family hexuronate transporter-like MFS transporter